MIPKSVSKVVLQYVLYCLYCSTVYVLHLTHVHVCACDLTILLQELSLSSFSMQFGVLAESHPYNPLWAQLGYVFPFWNRSRIAACVHVHVHVIVSLSLMAIHVHVYLYIPCLLVISCPFLLYTEYMSLQRPVWSSILSSQADQNNCHRQEQCYSEQAPLHPHVLHTLL